MSLSAQELFDQLYGGRQTRKRPTTKRSPRLVIREWGEDTAASAKYICVVFDETVGCLYLIGGLGTTEKLITKLRGYKKPHEVHQFEGKLKKHPKLPYKVISRNGRTKLGVRLSVDLKWKKIVVIPGTADFHFMIHNHFGRKDRVETGG